MKAARMHEYRKAPVCHCLDCKKSSGGEAATFFGVPEDDHDLGNLGNVE